MKNGLVSFFKWKNVLDPFFFNGQNPTKNQDSQKSNFTKYGVKII